MPEDGEMIPLSSLRVNEDNPRTITEEALSKLCESIKRDPEFMELRPIVVDEDNVILGGNQRFKACLRLGMEEVPAPWVKEAKDLTPEQRKRFIVVDNAPEGMAGDWNMEKLLQEWKETDLNNFGFEDLLSEFKQETNLQEEPNKDFYTNKIIPPIYEPKGNKPKINELFNNEKTINLCKEIDKLKISKEIAEFLKLAAERHTEFHFGKIAEFYCHAEKNVQELMEQSGLIIIDINKAIENGFVHLTENLGKICDLEYEDFKEENHD